MTRVKSHASHALVALHRHQGQERAHRLLSRNTRLKSGGKGRRGNKVFCVVEVAKNMLDVKGLRLCSVGGSNLGNRAQT